VDSARKAIGDSHLNERNIMVGNRHGRQFLSGGTFGGTKVHGN
jgi:hypothetical protein